MTNQELEYDALLRRYASMSIEELQKELLNLRDDLTKKQGRELPLVQEELKRRVNPQYDPKDYYEKMSPLMEERRKPIKSVYLVRYHLLESKKLPSRKFLAENSLAHLQLSTNEDASRKGLNEEERLRAKSQNDEVLIAEYRRLAKEYKTREKSRRKSQVSTASERDKGVELEIKQYIRAIVRTRISRPSLKDLERETTIPSATWYRRFGDIVWLSALHKELKKRQSQKYAKSEESKNHMREALEFIIEKLSSAKLPKRTVPLNKDIRDTSRKSGVYDDMDETRDDQVQRGR